MSFLDQILLEKHLILLNSGNLQEFWK